MRPQPELTSHIVVSIDELAAEFQAKHPELAGWKYWDWELVTRENKIHFIFVPPDYDPEKEVESDT